VSTIDTSYFTHIFDAFLTPDPVSYELTVSESDSPLLSSFTTTLHHKNPPVKILLSIAGDHAIFARMATKASSRKSFIDSTIEIGRKYGFDGLDLDWEFPQSTQEMEDLGVLLEEWRLALIKEARTTNRKPLLLTEAVYFAVDFFLTNKSKYPVASIIKNLDWVNVMCFDYHGSWDTSATGTHAWLRVLTALVETAASFPATGSLKANNRDQNLTVLMSGSSTIFMC